LRARGCGGFATNAGKIPIKDSGVFSSIACVKWQRIRGGDTVLRANSSGLTNSPRSAKYPPEFMRESDLAQRRRLPRFDDCGQNRATAQWRQGRIRPLKKS